MNFWKMTIAALVASAAPFVQALELKPYSAAALAEAQQAGKPVALHFHADWCPTCRAQEKSLLTLKQQQGLDMTVLVANFDTERDLKRKFGVRAQSTLVVLRGEKELARVVGDTTAEGLRGALKAAL